MEIVTRKEAKEKGSKRYFTGVPCRNGHVSERTARRGNCCECLSSKQKSSYLRDKEKIRKSQSEYYKRVYKNTYESRKVERNISCGGKSNTCQVCKNPKRAVVWDHNHTTGEFRGWLCNQCNTALGLLGDDYDRIVSLSNYIKEKSSIL